MDYYVSPGGHTAVGPFKLDDAREVAREMLNGEFGERHEYYEHPRYDASDDDEVELFAHVETVTDEGEQPEGVLLDSPHDP